MKKFFGIVFIMGVLLTGFSKVSSAEEECFTGVLTCPDGTGTLTLVCGDGPDEIFQVMDEYIDVFCGPI